MAITLAEAKVGMADKVDQQIVDMFRRSSLLLDNISVPNTRKNKKVHDFMHLRC